MLDENEKKIRPIRTKTGKYIVEVSSTNEPSEQAIKNVNRKINQLMNKKFGTKNQSK